MIARPDYSFWVAQRQEQVVAFTIVMSSANADLALLEYLAVHPDLQGLGIGRQFLRSLLRTLLASRRIVLIEAESDKPVPNNVRTKLQTELRSARRRRKLFYRSLGAREIAGLDYLMPPVSAGTPPPMDLLVVTARPVRHVPKSALHAWLTTLYTEVYVQPAHDPRLAAMLANLPEQIPLL